MQRPNFNSAIKITVSELVALRQSSQVFFFKPASVLSRQSGDYQSRFKGRGMEFSESRPYEPGDDIRNLDWRVMARTGKAHTKLFREERERPVFFSIDFRSPMFFATQGMYKSVMASRLASILAWNACQHSDRVGGLIFSDHSHEEIKPQRGKKGVLRLIQNLVHHPVWSDSQISPEVNNLHDVVLRLRRLARPGSLIFFLSDFRGFDEAVSNQLQQIARHSELVLLFIVDPLEKALPMSGRYRISNGEDEITLDTFDKQLLESYQQRFLQHEEQIEAMAQKGRMTLIKIMSNDDPVQALQNTLGFNGA